MSTPPTDQPPGFGSGTPPSRLASGLDAFAEQFRAQAESAGLPGSEHAINLTVVSRPAR
jgi:hypothetical protein